MLVQRCQSSFDSRTKAQGFELRFNNRVQLSKSVSSQIFASVQEPPDEEVELDWSAANVGYLRARCTCDEFFKGRLCRHIWATILEMDRSGPSRIPGSGRLEVVSEEPEGFVDDEYDELDPYFDENDFPKASRRNGTSTRRGISWRKQFEGVRNWLQHYGRVHGVAEGIATHKERELWFVLNVTATLTKEKLEIEFFQREKKKNGEWGVIRKQAVALAGSWLSERDRQLVQMLIGNQGVIQTGYSNYGYASGYSAYAYAGCTLSSALHEQILPALCATGRLTWVMDNNQPIEPDRVLAWDGGEPWRFRLVGAADDSRSRWNIQGQLYRGDETVSLDEPVVVMACGTILFQDRLARLDVAADFAWISALRASSSIFVPYKDRDRFLTEWWSQMSRTETQFPEALVVDPVCCAPEPKLVIKSPHKYFDSQQLFADAFFCYGDWEVGFHELSAGKFEAAANQVIVRDPARELEFEQQLFGFGVSPTDRRHDRGRYQLRKRQLPAIVDRLLQAGWAVVSEGVLIRRPGSFQLSVISEVDWFELRGEVDFEGVPASLPSLLAALRSGQKYIQLGDGTRGMLPDEWLKRYGGLADLGTADGEQIRFKRSQALLLDALLAAQENVQVDRSFGEFRKKLREFEGVSPGEATAGFTGELRPYQKDGLGWLDFLRDFEFGGCLADDMGLGKTVQVLAFLESRRTRRLKKNEQRRPSLVVVPKSLVFNWIEEGKRFTPQMRIANYTGLERAGLLKTPDDCDLLITTYGTLLRDIAELKDVRFDYAILDEAQAIKNSNSQSAKACRLLNADHRLAMTGTPVENHLGELWSLFEFLNPGMLGRSTAFNSMTRNGADPETLRLLGQSLRPFLLRRTKEQVLPDLPEKSEQTLYCEMDTKQRALYDELKEYYRASLAQRVKDVGLKKAKIHVLEALLRLRQAACHPGLLDKHKTTEPSAKLEALFEQLDEIVSGGHKALVFSQFTSLLAIVRQQLDTRKITYEYLDGSTRDRGQRVQRFQTDPDCPLFLISLKAGGHGLNLTAADYVFILDPWWNPAVEAQAVDRAHRIGQTRSVFAYRLICRDTVEDKILELQKTKRDLADAIVSEDNSLIRTLTADDLQLLLS